VRKSPSDQLRLTPLELAAGFCFGEEEVHLPRVPEALTPLAALEEALLPALQRPPCLVAFSGGRDSSGVLAAAAGLARRDGLEPPVPATFRFKGAPAAEESTWQELVIRHVGLDDWMRLEIDDELDYLGPLGTRLLRRHGVLWPPNSHFLVPLLERARDGSLVTGDGGDQSLAAGDHGRIRGVVRGRIKPRPRDARRLASALAPGPACWAVRARQGRYRIPWLRPEAQRRVQAKAARYRDCEPVRFDSRVRWTARLREISMMAWTDRLLAADTGAQLVSPLVDPVFLSALARAGGPFGWSSRTEIMQALFGGLLPEEVPARPTKANFIEVFWGPRTQEFVAGWSGEGVDAELVDAEALRAAWLEPRPIFAAALPLQAAWFRTQGEKDLQAPGPGAG
jgi:hypothetical protein